MPTPDHSPEDFEIHVDEDCLIPAMEEPTHTSQPDLPHAEEATRSETDNPSSLGSVEAEPVTDAEPVHASEPQGDINSISEPDTTDSNDTEVADNHTEEPASSALSTDSLDDWIQDGYVGDSDAHTDGHHVSELDHVSPEDSFVDGQHGSVDDAQLTDSEHTAADSSELDYTTDADTHGDAASSLLSSCDLERSHSVRTEALIQAAARAVLSMRQGHEQEDHQEADDSTLSSIGTEDDDADETVHANDDDVTSRPTSSASHTLPSPTAQSSVGESAGGSHNGADDDVFSDRSPRSSVHSSNEYYDDDVNEQATEKGQESPYVRSRVPSGVSASGASVVSDFSRLSRYDKDDFVPTSRDNRPAFRSPSSVRAIQMSSPTPSILTSPKRSAKRQTGFPTISRLGSPSMSGQYSPRGRGTPSRFKKEEAPLVLLHVTLLPLRWSYGDMMDHFEAKKLAPLAFSTEGIKNLRSAWRQLQDRLGDTVLERGILLSHPQNDYEVLEERTLEALELPVRRRARILECGHYLGPSNKTTVDEDMDDESIYSSDAESSDAERKEDKRHWCKTCRGEIKYEELGNERVFRIKVYASNGLMSAGAWDACWREMERTDIEVEPIIDASVQSDLAKLAAAFDHEHQQMLEAEQKQLEEEEQRFRLEAEQRLSLEEERQQLEAQRQQFEEERRLTLEEAHKQLEQERRKLEEEQRQRLEEERRQQFDEERQLLDAQRQQFEEQRLELEAQRKFVEEEQRQHLEEARRQELELEQKLIEEQRQELEVARQQFEEERRQRLEDEEELRKLQREEDEQKQLAASRSTSRNSYVEEELPSPATERPTSVEPESRRRDSDRLREVYGAHSRASSDGVANSSSPSIHIHVDSARQREEEQNTRQLALAAPQDSSLLLDAGVQDSRHPDAYNPPASAPSSSQQAYQRHEAPHRSLDSASLPELLGESIRVLLQDPKNIAIAVLVVFIAILTGQFATRQERGIDLYKPQQPQYQHHQLEAREPVPQVVMNAPPKVETVYQTVTAQPAPQIVSVSKEVETVYQTVTAQPVPEVVPVSKEVEIVYQTVTQYPNQDTATRVVETVYSTVTAHAAAPEVDSELTPSSADPILHPSFDLLDVEVSHLAVVSSLIALGLDPFVCPASAAPDTESDEQLFKTVNIDEPRHAVQGADSSPPSDKSAHDHKLAVLIASGSQTHDQDVDAPSPTSLRLTSTATSTSTLTKTMKSSETITETIVKTAVATPESDIRNAEFEDRDSSEMCAEPMLFMSATELLCGAI